MEAEGGEKEKGKIMIIYFSSWESHVSAVADQVN